MQKRHYYWSKTKRPVFLDSMLTDTADTEKIGVKNTAAQNLTPLNLPESRNDSMAQNQ